MLTTTIDGATTTMQYAVSAAGQGKVEKNEFPKTPRAVQAARDALADFEKSRSSSTASQGGLVQTKSVEPRDLVKSGGPLIEGLMYVPSLIATMCIIASLCGIGGESGATVLESTVEAGTEQCE